MSDTRRLGYWVLTTVWILFGAAMAAEAADLTGVVHDVTGDVVRAAAVIARRISGPERQVLTGPDGRFSLEIPPAGDLTIVVRAAGFAE